MTSARWRHWRRKVHEILELGGDVHPAGYIVNGFIIVLIVANALAFAAQTVEELATRYDAWFRAFNVFSVMVFTIEYALRVWSSVEIPVLSRMPPWRARAIFASRPIMIIDLLAFAPWYLTWLFPADLRFLRLLRVLRLFRLARFSPALQTLFRVCKEESGALLGSLLLMLILLLFASTGIYFLERHAQPEAFGSIPAASWWALATLTTVGYGDVVPVTPLGKMLGGVMMLLSVGMFALPVAIIATGFSRESVRHQFVATWSMVARVPLFEDMSRAELADITKVLDTRSYEPGVPIVRAGDVGENMYILASGEARLLLGKGRTVILKEGDIFGEMALLEHRRHEHDVIATTHCRLYVLDNRALARLSRRHPGMLDRIRRAATEQDESEVTQT
ncbi:cyclic nucleotide-gated ion channel [Methyloceanibacter sp. wino2]|uniref:cyclic nucleotide-gated ion channel n=1 Tax=Methyloceanibacter sp. wino2 TaxID=2170729 RepID=UPI000D3E3851|nr:cyclic nucleotide-gated ion channel [Methyloceanibacter sp. wino2]